MTLGDNDITNTHRALREIMLEASDDDVREILSEAGEDADALAARGRAAARRALANTQEDPSGLEDLHRGLGTLIQLLRRRDRVSVEELAEKACVPQEEVRGIENDPSFEPYPRTVYMLERYFKLPERTLVMLSGALRVEDDLREEATRFAASAKDIHALSREERKLLNSFVKILARYTDS